MESHSRLALVLSIIRSFTTESNNRYRYTKDELTSELYIYVESLIKSNPFIERGQIVKMGYSFCQKFAKKYRYDREYKLEPVPPIQPVPPTETNNTLKIWCETRYKRQNKRWFSRIVAYLYYVEGLPYVEIAEIFGKHRQAIQSIVWHVHKLKDIMPFKQNDIVLLVMDNPFFNHMLAWVKEPTEFGAMVEVESHSYPHRQRWTLRATTDEMVYIGTLAKLPESPKIADSVDGSKKVVSNAQAMLKPVIHTPAGDIPNGLHDPNVYLLQECQQCGQMKLRHNGPCLICDACGTTSGCG